MRKLILTLTVFLSLSVHSQVVINEIMQSNIDCVMDDLNQFPDSWVEIYNNTSASINLSAYKIGLDNNASTAWALPNKEVPAYGYALVYCDKEATGVHTDFRLDSGKGGAVYLFNGNTIVDKLEKIAKQPSPNISYGRKTDGADSWGYQAEPTPSMPNCGTVYTKTLSDVIFSQKGAVFTSNQLINLALTLPDGTPEGAIIRYTRNGSEPTLLNGYTYTSPITIGSTTNIRARIFCDGYLTPRSKVQSYIFHGREQTLPVISLTIDQKYLTDDQIGIYTEGTYSPGTPNYKYDWRRPVNIELFETDGTTCSLNQLCEMRVQGGATRSCALKSLAFYANKRFGEKQFKYEFFPDQRPGQTAYKSFIIRNAGNDFDYLYMRDAIIQRTMSSNVDIDWQAWRPAIIYINGEYRGMENIRERSGDDNIYTNYDGLEDIDMYENLWDLKCGTKDNFEAFKEFYNEHGHTMAEYSKWLDIEEFINIYAMNIFYNNRDWPGNNVVWWRPRTDNGRWRIIAKDTDFGLGLYGVTPTFNTIEWLYNPNYDPDCAWANGYEATRLFRRLMEDADFQREFIDHCAIYMGDFLNSKGTRVLWDPMYETIKTEYPIHRALYNQWWPNYNEELTNARTWLTQRPDAVYSMLQSKYSLGDIVPLKLITAGIDKDVLNKMVFEINGIPLRSGAFDGKYYAGRNLTITARAKTEDELKADGIDSSPVAVDVQSWYVISSSPATYTTKDLSMTMPTSASVVVIPTVTITSGIDNVAFADDQSSASDADGQFSGIYDLQGRKTSVTPSSGIYLIRDKAGKVQKVIQQGR